MLKRILIGLSLVLNIVLILVSFTPLANRLAEPLYLKPTLIKSELIVVLGGGAYEDGSLSAPSMERLLRGLVLYREGYGTTIAFVGGTIRDRVAKIGNTLRGYGLAADVVEAEIMAELADRLGVPSEAVYVEGASTNTYTNLKAVKRYMEREGLSSCLVVTSATHIRRAMAVAHRLGLNCYPAPVEINLAYRDSPQERIALMWNITWELAALALYRLYGYI